MQNPQGLSIYFGSTEHKLSLLTQRVEQLEEVVHKKKKGKLTTEQQRFLLFYHLGFVDAMVQNHTGSQNQKDLLVARMLNIDPDNARKFLSDIRKKDKLLLETESNYNFLVEQFQELGYPELEKKAEKILLAILNRKR